MAQINFTMATPNSEDTVQLTGTVYRVNLHWKKNSSCWFYIPKGICRMLNLQASQDAYFYIVEQTTLIVAFRNPNLKKAKRRKITYAKSKDDLTLVLPCSLLDKDFLQHKTMLQFINPIGNTNHEWQLRLL
jgi:hypothetical protein